MLIVPEHLKVVAPSAKFTLVTQNVDGLSTLAVREVCPTGEPPILEMHGRLFETICTICDHRVENFDSPICSALAGTENLVEKHATEPIIGLEDLPRCKKSDCNGLLRPGVVWFGEMPHHMEEINKIVDKADLALVVGTSSVVRCVLCFTF
jgi:NAD-dependent deacetylase sirtuin 5